MFFFFLLVICLWYICRVKDSTDSKLYSLVASKLAVSLRDIRDCSISAPTKTFITNILVNDYFCNKAHQV